MKLSAAIIVLALLPVTAVDATTPGNKSCLAAWAKKKGWDNRIPAAFGGN